MLSVGTVVMGVEDIHRALAFWTQALDYVPKREINVEDDFAILVPVAGHGTHVALDVSETPVPQHPRVHLDLYAGDAADQASEVERLVALGATRVDWDRYPETPTSLSWPIPRATASASSIRAADTLAGIVTDR